MPLLAHQISIYQHYPIEFWLLLSFVFLHQISLFHHHKGKLLFVCRVHFLDVLQSIMLLAFASCFFKTLTAILVLLLFFGGYYIYSSGIFGASVTENISEHSITDEERLIEYEEYGITYDESSQSYLYQDSLIKNLRDGDFLYTNAAGSIKLIIQRDDNGHIQSIDVE